MFINLLGPDGTGKTTQLELLASWITQSHGVPFRTVTKSDIFDPARFPDCRFFGCDYPFMAHEQLPIMRGGSRALCLYMMLSLNVTRYPPQPGEVVVADGYWYKHWATEKALGLPNDWLLALGSQMPEPEVTLCLDASPESVLARGREHYPYESGLDLECRPASFARHQARVRANILEIAAVRGWPIVDASQSVQEVHERIRDHLREPLATLRSIAPKQGSA